MCAMRKTDILARSRKRAFINSYICSKTNFGMNNEKEYFAFISYQRKDEEWAEWLQHQLEHYRLPSNIIEEHPELPCEVRPLFRDATELAGGVLAKEINSALENSYFLIVICSPNSAKSIWVNKEVQTFIDLGRLEYVIPFIVDGIPYTQSGDECFVPALAKLKGDEHELLGINISEMGREVASIKVVARMLNLRFDSLWQRYEREKEEERLRLIETNNKILRNQARFVAEKALSVLSEGDSFFARLLVLEVLPKNLSLPDRPYVPEAEFALRQISDHQTACLKGHNECVFYAEFSPDGKFVIAATGTLGGGGGRIGVWDSGTGQLLKLITGHITMTNSVKYNSAGDLMVSAGGRSICVWDVKKGKEIKTFEVDGGVDYAEFSPDGSLILSLTSNGGTIRIWDWEKETLTKTIHSYSFFHNLKDPFISSFSAAMFCPDGNSIAMSSYSDSIIVIWDINKERVILSVNCGDFTSYAINPNGKTIASVNRDNTIHIWDIKSGKKIKTLKGHTAVVNCISYNNDGNMLVSSSEDKTIRIWDITEGTTINSFQDNTATFRSVRFSPDCKRIVSTANNGNIRLWDVKPSVDNNRIINKETGNITSIKFFSNNTKIATSSNGENEIKIWDLDNLVIKHRLKVENYSPQFAISSNDKYIAIIDDKKIKVWDTEKGKFIKEFTDNKWRYTGVAFNLGSIVLNAITWDGRLKSWNIDSGEELRSIDFEKSVDNVTLGPDGTKVAEWSFNSISIYDTKKRIVTNLNGHFNCVNHVSFSPDGLSVLSASDDKTIRIWNVETGKMRILTGHTDAVNYAEFSRDGNRIISASKDKSVRIWDVNSGQMIHKIDTLSKRMFKGAKMATFSFDGKSFLSVSEGEPTVVYGEPIKTIDIDTGKVEYKPEMIITDNDILEVGTFLSLQDLIDQTRERFKDHPLTPEERHQYYLE